jgi:uncharacterized protein involved in exopolysaccharide biosynthesis
MADGVGLKQSEKIDYLAVLISRWKLIALGTLIVALAVAGISLLFPNIYEASAILVVTPSQFKTELKPSIFPSQTYKRMLEGKGLIFKVLERMRTAHPADFDNVTVEDISKNLKVDLEVVARQQPAVESPLLVLYARHEKPDYAMEMSNLWAEEFISLNKRIQKTRTEDTDRFISEQFKEGSQKLALAEKAITDFESAAQIEVLELQLAAVMNQVKRLCEELEKTKEDIASETRALEVVEEKIAAVEVDGKWLGQMTDGRENKAELNNFQKELANELIRVVDKYMQMTESLASFSRTYDVETMDKRRNQLREMLMENQRRLKQLSANRKALEGAQSAILNRLTEVQPTITLKKSLPEEVVWEKILGNPTKKDTEKLTGIQLASEEINPNYTQLNNRLFVLKEQFESVVSEEKYLTEVVSQAEEELKKLESDLCVLRKQWTDLQNSYEEVKKQFMSRYADYIKWLDERIQRKINIARLRSNLALLEERYKERQDEIRHLSTELGRNKDKREELRRAVEVAKHAYELLKNKVEESRIATAEEVEEVRLVCSAIKPGKKVSPQRSLITIVAAIIGFLVSSLGVMLFEYHSRIAEESKRKV